MPLRVCLVCLGNICRSPTAEAVLRHKVEEAGLHEDILIESAGTGGWHVGDGPDARAVAAGKKRGYTVGGRAAQFRSTDFDRFDHVVAMDRSNQESLIQLARTDADVDKISLFRNWDPRSPKDAEVPDPYYGAARGFDEVLDICESGAAALLAELRRELP